VAILVRRRLAVLLGLLLALAVVAVGAYLLIDALSGDGEDQKSAPAPAVVVHERQPPATEDLGFPAFATKNTTRVAGLDPVADAAGVALATYPSAGGVKGPAAVSLVADDDWASGIAAASLAAPPIGAPILVAGPNDVPTLTADALEGLAPTGSPQTDGKQAFAIGSASRPEGLDTERVQGADPAAIAVAIDGLRQRLAGDRPRHVVLASSEEPAFAMPAAAWAARSGDPVLFVSRKRVPKATLDGLRGDRKVPVYVLGPPGVISDKVLDQVRKVAANVTRIGAPDPVANAIAFARFASGTFGWDINDPGHGFVIANTTRPLDAGAAAPLSASGDWGPLLVTDEPGSVPSALRQYLLDVKPGYVGDPTRAVYNHVWLIGDQNAISVGFPSPVDDLAEVVPVRSGGGARLGPLPGTPQHEPKRPSR
jgi:hypothetical protein